MTERRWQALDNVLLMMNALPSRVTRRQLYAFAVACCDLVPPSDDAPATFRRAVELAAAVVGGSAPGDLLALEKQASRECGAEYGRHPGHPLALAALRLSSSDFGPTLAYHVALFTLQAEMPVHTPIQSCQQCERRAGLLREVVGPRRRPRMLVRWRTPTVKALAETADLDRAFDRLPILADALEEAGCDAAELLAHLRGPGPHVRGCWALDLVLGRT